MALGILSLKTPREISLDRLEADFPQAIFFPKLRQTTLWHFAKRLASSQTLVLLVLDPSLHRNTTSLLETFPPLKVDNWLQSEVPQRFKSLVAGVKSTPKSLWEKDDER